MAHVPPEDCADGLAKAIALLEEVLGDRVRRLTAPSREAIDRVARALAQSEGAEQAREIAFHLTDWAVDAAFLLAIHLFPERFTNEEIADGVESFLVHAPNHVAAAAVLKGYPPADIFGVTDFGAQPETER